MLKAKAAKRSIPKLEEERTLLNEEYKRDSRRLRSIKNKIYQIFFV